jgi:Tfp pilus assembly protein PilV
MAEEKRVATRKRKTAATQTPERLEATPVEPKPETKKAAPKKRTTTAKQAPVTKSQDTAAPRKTATRKAPVRKAPRARTSTTGAVSDEARYKMIQDAAYYLAERRGFAPGHAQEDWAEAERQVDEQLRARHGIQ